MDILMCLGLIWFIKCLELHHIHGEEYYPIKTAGINYIILTLLLGVAILYSVFKFNSFYMNKKTGIYLLISYIIFISFAIFASSNQIFGGVAEC